MGLVIVPAEEWADISSNRDWTEEVHFRLNVPFYVDREAEDTEFNKAADGDIVVRGPVYVGNQEMLDRHGELVDMGAIMDAWSGENGYDVNPVILYNHSKTHGVIGMMTDVEMGKWGDFDFDVPIGRAVIDGGEKDIVRKIRKGMLRSFSIGFMAKAAVKECIDGDEDNCYMIFTDIEWVETSVVDIPSSREAIFKVEKRLIVDDSSEKASMSRDEHPEMNLENDCVDGCSCNQCTFENWAHESPIEHPEIPDSGDIKAVCTCGSLIKELAEPIEPTTVDTDTFIDPLPSSAKLEATDMTDETEEILIKEVMEHPEGQDVSMPSPTEALMAVTTAIGELSARMNDIESQFNKTVTQDEEISELEAQNATLTELVGDLTAAKEVADEEANIANQVAERVAELAKNFPQTVEVTVEPTQKSVKGTVEEPTTPDRRANIHDPSIHVSPGMKGLSDWLEQQLVSRGGLNR